MKKIHLHTYVKSFAENKDTAKDIRLKQIVPALKANEDITIDFAGVNEMTQSFCHALLSEVIRNYGIGVLDKISFAHCNDDIQNVVEIVVEYMQ